MNIYHLYSHWIFNSSKKTWFHEATKGPEHRKYRVRDEISSKQIEGMASIDLLDLGGGGSLSFVLARAGASFDACCWHIRCGRRLLVGAAARVRGGVGVAG